MSRARNGGAAARRAMLRWGWRLFRREWRQQILVLTLLTVAVAVAAFAGAFGYNFPRTADGRLGSASHEITFNATQPQAGADVAAARRYFGTIEVITRQAVAVPGSSGRLEFRSEDPNGPYSRPMLGLREGRYPTGADEIALTRLVARALDVTVGQTLSLTTRAESAAVGAGRTATRQNMAWRVVGIVENPADFDDQFALVPPDRLDTADRVSILTDSRRDVEAFRSQMTVPGNVDRETRPVHERAATALVTLSLAAVGLLLVALIAAAGFVVLAKRRLRQFGMLAAVGATEQQVRLVTVINGVLVGLIAAGAGTALGVAAWAGALGRIESAAGHRISGLATPPWLLLTCMGLAVAAATASAWWPARAIARVPVLEALSARPPRPKPAHRSALVAVALVGAGLALLHWGDGGKHPVPVLVGMPAIVVGVLFSAPIAIQALARLAGRLPIAGRLALRDLARYQARSGAALAAIALALGVPVGIVVTASAEESQAPKTNLGANQLVFRTGDTLDPLLVPQRSTEATRTLDGRVQQFAATLGGARVFPLDMAVDPTLPTDFTLGGEGGRHAAALFWQAVGSDRAEGIPLYVATPELLQRFGAASTDVAAHEIWFSETSGELKLFSNKANHTPVTDVSRIPRDDHWQLPGAFVSPTAVTGHGWLTTRTGWLVETAAPLTAAQQSAARDLAISAGLTVETMHPRASLGSLRTGATAAGMLLALGVLAMTVGLIRSEVAGDVRTLTAVGAGSGMRRKLTAATAGALALLGVVLGLAAAYLALVGAYLGHLDKLANVPIGDLAVTALGVPLLATAAGWLLAGHQPPAIARAALD